ncbi:MAG: bifunctional phosphopantothenoylcysteine decarboxylase/phosphopantothenate--cysteine ligase CoaBC [Candidatus Thermoplasmatota archaeon]|jgi:phosphopantothenoylcysteine decarboxylase/phosphopantothenate--cysteine ligase|nr:bifunctional phosphopantothenoylcysteine decarboxylase/phosphopantothenate--cysteine ligase CoaBC [Candidatus Thermoplasmatota archaeon]
MHPSEGIYIIKSQKLKGKKIVLGITGSIGAVRCVRFIREMIRHGAEIIPVMTKDALEIITSKSICFASGKEPVTEITGDVEHVRYCGMVESRVDLFLIAPCTANTVSKIVRGICDTTVTLFASTAIGSGIPLMILPAMHESMYNHPSIKANVRKLKDMGADIIEPVLSERKAKMANVDIVVEHVLRAFGSKDLIGKKILIIAGSTAEPMDDIRMITNRSSGKTGVALAVNAFRRGGEVELWYGRAKVEAPYFIKTRDFESVDNLMGLVDYSNLYRFDIIINCAAISDFTMKKQKGKIKSRTDKLVIELSPTPKVIELIKKNAPESYIVAFKLESGLPEKELIDNANRRLNELDIDMIIANDLEEVRGDKGRVHIIKRDGKVQSIEGRKTDNANQIFNEILKE